MSLREISKNVENEYGRRGGGPGGVAFDGAGQVNGEDLILTGDISTPAVSSLARISSGKLRLI